MIWQQIFSALKFFKVREASKSGFRPLSNTTTWHQNNQSVINGVWIQSLSVGTPAALMSNKQILILQVGHSQRWENCQNAGEFFLLCVGSHLIGACTFRLLKASTGLCWMAKLWQSVIAELSTLPLTIRTQRSKIKQSTCFLIFSSLLFLLCCQNAESVLIKL